MNRTILPYPLLLVVAALVAAPAQAKLYKKTLDASSVSRIAVETCSSKVIVAGWDKPEVVIKWNKKKAPLVNSSDGLVVVQTQDVQQKCRRQWFTERDEPDISVWAPKSVVLDVKTISGEIGVDSRNQRTGLHSVSGCISARNLGGSTKIRTVSGDIRAVELKQDLSIESVSGEIEVKTLQANRLSANTVSGDIELSQVTVKECEVHSQSGDIKFRGSVRQQGRMQLETFSGEVDIYFPAESAFSVDAKTKSGNIEIDQQLEISKLNGNQLKGKVGSGGPELRLSSFSGDITLRTAN